MQPTTPREFLKVALQRLDAAEQIMDKLRLTLEAQYIGGYSIECSLKALILEKTPAGPARDEIYYKLTHGATYHIKEHLLARLKERGVELTLDLAKRMRRFDWETGLRYEIGRKDTGETNGLLNTARAIYNWVEAQIS